MSQAKSSRKTRLSVSYFEHEQPVDESEVLIVPMMAYDLVLGLPWFKARNPEIDWEAGKLLSLQRRQPQPNNHGKEASSETGPDIQTLSATAFRDLCSSDEVSHTFSLTLGECIGLLGATTRGHLNGSRAGTTLSRETGELSLHRICESTRLIAACRLQQLNLCQNAGAFQITRRLGRFTICHTKTAPFQ
jgi:hypothetical protein